MNIVNLYENYNNYFDAEQKWIFEKYSRIASENNYKIYLVGGIVRDLLLGLKNLDIDITVEGNAIEFVRILEKDGLVKILSVHEDFGTVKVETCGDIRGLNIDFASTRSEIYKDAGHLPTVSEIGCSLKKDVLRRDFTVNSLALSLNHSNSLNDEKFADLVDYVGGFSDLKSKRIRVLHDKSFIDDPTRIIRGLKYATRLGFELDASTLGLQKAYLENVNYDMCYKRVKVELKLTLGLNSDECFYKFLDQKIYKLVSKKDVELSRVKVADLIEKYKVENSWLVYLCPILIENDYLSLLLEKLQLNKKETKIVVGLKRLLNVKLLDSDFEIYKAFDGMYVESLLVFSLMEREGCDASKVFRYLDLLRDIKLSVTGEDLLSVGLKPSKKFSEVFDYVLKHKLENPQLTISEERCLLIEYIKSIEM